MPAQNYDSLLDALQTQELAAQQARQEVRKLKREIVAQEGLADLRHTHAQAMRAFCEAVLGLVKREAVYEVLCQTTVQRLKWDAALVLEVGADVHVRASFHATQRQIAQLNQSLGLMPKFLKAYAHQEVLSTVGKDDAVALALRSVLMTDEVAAVPILFGGQLYGYLITCAHTERGKKRGIDDVRFLSSLTSVAAHVVEHARIFQGLEDQNEKLRKLDELKDSFISITSHQLRTPLSIVKWILSLLDSDVEIKKLKDQHALIGQAYISNERLIHVVNDLLNVSRIQDGKLPYTPQPADLRVLLEDLVTGMQKLCEAKRVTLSCDYVTELPLLQMDAILFKEAVQNILDNALDYNQEGGLIKVTVFRENDWAVLEVMNTGQGIQKKDLSTIFDQFYRSPEAMTAHPNGNGLGLYLARAIIQQHGGSVSCSSQPGKETTFRITVPIHE
jgi:signal transduction histidine kinase